LVVPATSLLQTLATQSAEHSFGRDQVEGDNQDVVTSAGQRRHAVRSDIGQS
jgi:hypothetical protein